jgi:K+-transporting ATPase c subunit
MLRSVSKSLWLLAFAVVLVCGIYPGILWAIGQTLWSFQVNGSIVNGPDGKAVGSLLVAQPFTKDEYFWPRPSAASYDAPSARSRSTAPDRRRVSSRRPMSRLGSRPISSAANQASSPNGRTRTIRSPRVG